MAQAHTREDNTHVDSPIHTGVTKDPASTPGYWRWFLPAISGRYILRALLTLDSRVDATGWLSKGVGKRIAPIVDFTRKEGSKDFIVSHALDPNHLEYNKTFANGFEHIRGLMEQEGIKHDKAGGMLREAVTNHQLWKLPVNFESLPKETQSHFIRSQQSYEHEYKSTIDRIKSHSKAKEFDAWYDTALGVASLAVTGTYAARTVNDIKKIFAETVAYETGKDPSKVNFISDIRHSNNVLVKETYRNFLKKNAVRFGTDLTLFTNYLLRPFKAPPLYFSDLWVGLKGASLMVEVMHKQTTIFEDLLSLVDEKLNPIKGLGAPLDVNEIFDLYQKYTLIHDPKATFHDTLSSQNQDGRNWLQSENLFLRITNLMNQTYKYKHVHNGTNPEETGADFTLPKFLYLLGHHMIDTYKPQESMAYVEVANKYGIEAVKDVKQRMERGIPLEQALEPYPVDLNYQKHTNAKDELKMETFPVQPASHATKGQQQQPATNENSNQGSKQWTSNDNQPLPSRPSYHIQEPHHQQPVHSAAQQQTV